MTRIAVGVDGSEGSVAALRWALEEAEMRGGEVEAVHAWEVPVPALMFDGVVPPVPDGDFAGEARAAVEHAIKDAREGAEARVTVPVPVTVSVPNGPAAASLVRASDGADLLVVGSRGRGGFAGLLLGSVSQQCAHHAKCPVVIVRSHA